MDLSGILLFFWPLKLLWPLWIRRSHSQLDRCESVTCHFPSGGWECSEDSPSEYRKYASWKQHCAKGWRGNWPDICHSPELGSPSSSLRRWQISACPHTSQTMLCTYCLAVRWYSFSVLLEYKLVHLPGRALREPCPHWAKSLTFLVRKPFWEQLV